MGGTKRGRGLGGTTSTYEILDRKTCQVEIILLEYVKTNSSTYKTFILEQKRCLRHLRQYLEVAGLSLGATVLKIVPA